MAIDAVPSSNTMTAVGAGGGTGAPTGDAGVTGGAPASGAPAPLPPADSLQLHPLDLDGALRILLVETRTTLGLPDVGVPLGLSTTAPQALVQMVLEALPEPSTLAPAAWLAGAARTLALTAAALDAGAAAVSGWHQVPGPVVDAVLTTRALVSNMLTDDPSSPFWLRPEWLGLAPRMQSFWRRRRRARRALQDPDGLSWEREGQQS